MINQNISKVHAKGIYGYIFEEMLNDSNEYYRNINKAIIYKKPTPIQIVKVDYPKRSKAKITEAYFKIPSTTDYNGIYKGKYIDYEAKETNKLSFDFSNIHHHQISHLMKISTHGGIGFILIYFRQINEVYLIDINDFYNLYTNGTKKSINIQEISKLGYKVNFKYAPRVDYLEIVDKLYFK